MKKATLIMMAVLLCIAITVPVGSASSDPWWRTKEYFGGGIDCSGVPFWAVNKVLDTKTYNAESPIPENAHKQYDAFLQDNLKITKTNGGFNSKELEPGDLIFIDTETKGKLEFDEKSGELLSGEVDHVLVYLGKDDKGDELVCHAVWGKDKEVVVQTLDSALKRGVGGGKTYFDCCAGCGRFTKLTKEQRKKVAELAKSLKGAPYQYGAKGYDVKDKEFVTAETIIEGGYVWNWKYNDELKIKIIKEELNKEGIISEKLRAIFKTEGYSFSEYAVVTKVKGDRWMIKDRGISYIVEIENGKLNIYKNEKENENEDLGGIDFSSIQLNYISVSSDKDGGTFSYVLKAQKAEEGDNIIDIEDATELSLNTFFIGLTLPESKFWVNLNPWEPDVIMDEDLINTDVGRIMLEADFQMKRDLCRYENPCESKIGEEFWWLLEKKAEDLAEGCTKKHPNEIEDADNVLFSAAMVFWIVPDKTEVYGTDDEVYIVNITLNIESKGEYEYSAYHIVNQNPFVSDDCKEDLNEAADEFGRYWMELEEEMILPLVVQEVNYGRNYSDLRQVYTSLALAQWYKDNYWYNKYWYTSGIFTDRIDTKDLTGLESKYTWSAEGIWSDYVRSFEEGEYHCWKNRTYEERGYIITESMPYSHGGVAFMAIILTSIGSSMPSDLKELTSEAVNSSFANEGDYYYFGDRMYVQPTTTTLKQPGFGAIFAILGLLVVAYLLRRRK